MNMDRNKLLNEIKNNSSRWIYGEYIAGYSHLNNPIPDKNDIIVRVETINELDYLIKSAWLLNEKISIITPFPLLYESLFESHDSWDSEEWYISKKYISWSEGVENFNNIKLYPSVLIKYENMSFEKSEFSIISVQNKKEKG
jgi:hypothetical protein